MNGKKRNNGTLVYYCRNYFDCGRTGALFCPGRFALVWQATRRYPHRERTQKGIYPHHLYGVGQHYTNRNSEPDPVASKVKEW
jgi:hypothetical protein